MFLAMNKLKTADIVFFIVLAIIIAVVVLVYFLITLLKRKMYAERRESLRQREMNFKHGEVDSVEALPQQEENTETEQEEEKDDSVKESE